MTDYDYKTVSVRANGGRKAMFRGVDATTHGEVDEVVAGVAQDGYELHLMSVEAGEVWLIFRKDNRAGVESGNTGS